MRRSVSNVTIALLAVLAIAGCSRSNDSTSNLDNSTDSLLSSNPVEQPAGDITPQSTYDQQQSPPETKAPAPRPTTRPRTRPASSSPSTQAPRDPGVTVSAGTPISVGVNTQISSENANVGDTWTGEVKDAVIVGDRVVIPAGSTVHGVITAARPAKKGDLAMLDLAVTSVEANGRTLDVDASTQEIVAGSPRARNLGAVAGGAAAGALIGKAVGGGGKGALIGGLIGAAGAGAGVAASKGYQVVLKEGTTLTFTVDRNTTVRS
jgi:hypothetical protein